MVDVWRRMNWWTQTGLTPMEAVLSKLVGAAAFNTLMSLTPDRRFLVSRIAEAVGQSEQEIVSHAAARLSLPFLQRVPPTRLRSSSLMPDVEALRAMGAMPLATEGVLSGIACADPSYIDPLVRCTGKVPISLAPWSLIDQALCTIDMSCDTSPTTELRSTTVATHILAHLVHVSRRYGAVALRLNVGADGSYSFKTMEGRTASGTLDPSILAEMRVELGESLRKGVVLLPPADESEAFVCRVRHGGRSDRFLLDWGSAVIGESSGDMSEELQSTASTMEISVLVVDDNDAFRQVVERYLAKNGYAVVTAGSVDEAMRHLESEQLPEVVIADVHMPHASGLSLLRRIRNDARMRDTPVILLTSDDSIETELQGISLGADAFVSKSEDPRVLCAQLRRFATRCALRRAA